MFKRFVVVLLTFATVFTAFAPRAVAATRTRPVTLSIVSSTCVNYKWVLTLAATSTTAKTVDYYDDSDYGIRDIQLSIVLQPNIKYEFEYEPGSSVQDLHGGLFPAGYGGWDKVDPLATIVTYAPHIAYPDAG